jgi:hypothetical protein
MADIDLEDLFEQTRQAIYSGHQKPAADLLDKIKTLHDKILTEEEERADRMVEVLMDRNMAMINALLGVENGIPLLSPDDEVKLATVMRKRAGLGTRSLTVPQILTMSEDFDPREEIRQLKEHIRVLTIARDEACTAHMEKREAVWALEEEVARLKRRAVSDRKIEGED